MGDQTIQTQSLNQKLIKQEVTEIDRFLITTTATTEQCMVQRTLEQQPKIFKKKTQLPLLIDTVSVN